MPSYIPVVIADAADAPPEASADMMLMMPRRADTLCRYPCRYYVYWRQQSQEWLPLMRHDAAISPDYGGYATPLRYAAMLPMLMLSLLLMLRRRMAGAVMPPAPVYAPLLLLMPEAIRR